MGSQRVGHDWATSTPFKNTHPLSTCYMSVSSVLAFSALSLSSTPRCWVPCSANKQWQLFHAAHQIQTAGTQQVPFQRPSWGKYNFITHNPHPHCHWGWSLHQIRDTLEWPSSPYQHWFNPVLMAWLWVIEKNIIFEYVPSQCPSPSLLHWWFLCESMGVSSQQITMLDFASCRWQASEIRGQKERALFYKGFPGDIVVRNLPANEGNETWVRYLSWGDPLEEGMATHSSILGWIIPWTEKPGRL